jgi:hypothetical protein
VVKKCRTPKEDRAAKRRDPDGGKKGPAKEGAGF